MQWCNGATPTKTWVEVHNGRLKWRCLMTRGPNQGNPSFCCFTEEQKPQRWDGSYSSGSIYATFAGYQIHFCRVCNANGWEDWETGLKIGLAYFRCCSWHNGGETKLICNSAARSSSGCQKQPCLHMHDVTDADPVRFIVLIQVSWGDADRKICPYNIEEVLGVHTAEIFATVPKCNGRTVAAGQRRHRLLTPSPLLPGVPCGPGSPLSPFSPCSPGGPIKPINPGWPCGNEDKCVTLCKEKPAVMLHLLPGDLCTNNKRLWMSHIQGTANKEAVQRN